MVNTESNCSALFDSVKEALIRFSGTGFWKRPISEVNPGAAKWHTTTMSWFRELCIIFGKDRATGNLAENLADVVEEVNAEVADEQFVQEEMQPGANSDEISSKKKRKKEKIIFVNAILSNDI